MFRKKYTMKSMWSFQLQINLNQKINLLQWNVFPINIWNTVILKDVVVMKLYIYNLLSLYIYIHAIMKTMCPPGYHHNGFMATHALEHMTALLILCSLLRSTWLWSLYFALCLACWAVFGSLLPAMCVTLHHVHKCMSCHEVIMIITGNITKSPKCESLLTMSSHSVFVLMDYG